MSFREENVQDLKQTQQFLLQLCCCLFQILERCHGNVYLTAGEVRREETSSSNRLTWFSCSACSSKKQSMESEKQEIFPSDTELVLLVPYRFCWFLQFLCEQNERRIFVHKLFPDQLFGSEGPRPGFLHGAVMCSWVSLRRSGPGLDRVRTDGWRLRAEGPHLHAPNWLH